MKYAAVIVTYNRIQKLTKTLNSFSGQVLPVDYIIVVDNGSTDGTSEYLENWRQFAPEKRIVITNKTNLGGAGGFHTGLEYAQSMEVDWIYVSDDDAYPERDAIAKLDKYINSHNTDEIVVICSAVLGHEKIAVEHRRRIQLKELHIIEKNVDEEEYLKESFELDLYSYVGAVFKRDVLSRINFCSFCVWS